MYKLIWMNNYILYKNKIIKNPPKINQINNKALHKKNTNLKHIINPTNDTKSEFSKNKQI